jgi:Flp pilus assembly protein TadG
MLFLYDGGALRATPQPPGPWSRRLLHDSRGATLVLVALAATVLLGFTALGVETGLWYAVKRQDQSAADAAALSGAYERAAGQPYSQICGQVKHDAAANGFPFQSYSCPSSSPACTSPSSGQMCANNPPVIGSNVGDDKAVEVILNRQQNTYLANLFLPSVTIGTRAGVTCPSNGISGVTIIAGSQTGTKGGGLQIKSGTVTLSAPTARIPSGCTLGSTPCIPSGILFYQDPADADTSKAGSGLTGDSTITANGTTSLLGAMYAPATNVTFTGNANSTCFIVISLTMSYQGDSTMSGNQAACQAVGVTGPTVMNISLTE